MMAVVVNGLPDYIAQSYDLPVPFFVFFKKRSLLLLCNYDANAAECRWIDLRGSIMHQRCKYASNWDLQLDVQLGHNAASSRAIRRSAINAVIEWRGFPIHSFVDAAGTL